MLISDLGGGKTTLTKSIVAGTGSADEVSSPSFTLTNRYQAPQGFELAHYDFYRLQEGGVLAEALKEDLASRQIVTILEWPEIIEGLIEDPALVVSITAVSDTQRVIELDDPSESYQHLLKDLQ